jgi:hypothetical protein
MVCPAPLHSEARLSGSRTSPVRTLARGREGLLVAALCFLAAVRVFVYSAAFPVANNVDESAHFDLVQKYAAGRIPIECRGPYEDSSREILSAVSSPEFLSGPARFEDGKIPPPYWTYPPAEAREKAGKLADYMMKYTNKESCSPPVYYVAAALWERLGALLGIAGRGTPFWVRFLNIPNIVLLVILAHRFAMKFWPDDSFTRIAAPALVAFLPQDTFFSINSDVLSPLFFGFALYLALRLLLEDRGIAAHALTGLCVAAAMLTKLSNFVIAPLVAAVLLARFARAGRSGSARGAVLSGLTLIVAAGAPVAAWMAHNRRIGADLLGVEEKARGLGWLALPFGQRLRNPVLRPWGAADFLYETARTFWRGEFTWHGAPLASGAVDAIYVGTTAVFLLAWFVSRFANRRAGSLASRAAEAVCGASLVLFLLFFVWASVKYDYGVCPYPSRARPYLRSGRLMLGALVPFVTLYAIGLRTVCSTLRRPALAYAALVAMLLLTVLSEIALSLPVFRSAYGWFHLP